LRKKHPTQKRIQRGGRITGPEGFEVGRKGESRSPLKKQYKKAVLLHIYRRGHD